MTLLSVRGGERTLTLRYVPVLPWAFMAVTLVGVGQVVAALLAGRLDAGIGPAIALTLLVGMVLAVALTSGQLAALTFDRARDLVCLRRYGLRGRSVVERPLSEVVDVEVFVLRRGLHRLELRMRSGERLAVTEHYNLVVGSGWLRRLGTYLGLDPTIVDGANS